NASAEQAGGVIRVRDKTSDAEQHDHKYDTRIFDFYLRGAQAHEQNAIQERLGQDQQLHSQLNELCTVIDGLSKCPSHAAPADLHEKVKARVASAAPVRLQRRETAPPAVEAEPRIIRLQNWRELTAVAAMIVIAVGMGVPSLLQMRQR